MFSINLCNVRILFWAKKSVYLASNIFSFTSDKIGQLWVCFNTLHHNTIIQHLISENICYLLFLCSRIPAPKWVQLSFAAYKMGWAAVWCGFQLNFSSIRRLLTTLSNALLPLEKYVGAQGCINFYFISWFDCVHQAFQ